jgi:hypothetical protein
VPIKAGSGESGVKRLTMGLLGFGKRSIDVEDQGACFNKQRPDTIRGQVRGKRFAHFPNIPKSQFSNRSARDVQGRQGIERRSPTSQSGLGDLGNSLFFG